MNPYILLQGPFAWAIAAAIVEGKLVPDLIEESIKVKFFYENIDRIVAAASIGIDETKDKLKHEIQVIGNLKIAAEETNTAVSIDYVPELRNTIIQYVNSLITKCKGYTKSYGYFRHVLLN